MNPKKFLLAFIIVGVVFNVLDGLIHGGILGSTYKELTFMRKDDPIVWYIVLDFVVALVLVWVYEKVKGSFARSMGGGALFGFYAGVLVTFPAMLGMKLMITDFPYYLSWVWVISGVVCYTIAGLIIGAIYKEKAAA